MAKVLLKDGGCPGDWLCMSAACLSIQQQYPEFRFRLGNCAPDIFDNAPWTFTGPEDKVLSVQYGWVVSQASRVNYHITQAHHLEICKKLGLACPMLTDRPHIYHGGRPPRVIQEPYCVINSGWKRDWTVKNWGFAHWQEVVDWIRHELKLQVVQVGAHSPPWHVHRPLKGVINLVGQTNTRQLFALAYWSQFGLGHESYLHHVFASHHHAERDRPSIPFVCVATGWLPRRWASYNTEIYLTRQGTMDCCRDGGCSRGKIEECYYPAQLAGETIPRCMQSIAPAEVIQAIKTMYQGGTVLQSPRPYTLISPDRLAQLGRLAKLAASLPGDMAELGVYKGGSAHLVAHAVPHKTLHLFDTFTGIPEDDALPGGHKKGEFRSILEEVRDNLKGLNVVFHPGIFPAAAGDAGEKRFCFVHLDGDTYQTTRTAFEWFWKRLVPGGFIVLDDYKWRNCPGVEKTLAETVGLAAVVQSTHYQAYVQKPADCTCSWPFPREHNGSGHAVNCPRHLYWRDNHRNLIPAGCPECEKKQKAALG